jgi:3-hydroxybutyryl-CoA dehydrogenase
MNGNSQATIDARRLLRGLFDDAVDMAARRFASATDIDTAMRLGAGHPAGPFELLAASGEATAPDAGPPSALDSVIPWSGRVAVVGTGLMATGIAECFAKADVPTVLLGRSKDSLSKARGALERSLARAVQRGRLDDGAATAAMANVHVTEDASDVCDCDLAIEAVAEDLSIKRSVLRRLDTALPETVWFATNTSSYTVGDLAAAIETPRRLSALHFFNPAPAMRLIEIIDPQGRAAVINESHGIARRIGKTAVVCGDEHGFVVNRLLIPYLNDAVRAVEDGVDATDLDLMMREHLGHPMGPIALVDLIGLDVTVAALDSMHRAFGDPRLAPARTLRTLAAGGRLGKKCGHGFYRYSI